VFLWKFLNVSILLGINNSLINIDDDDVDGDDDDDVKSCTNTYREPV